jgi:hypothetical protein
MAPLQNDPSTPLHKWDVVKSFDKASECEAQRDIMFERRKNTAANQPRKSEDASFRIGTLGVCIATDDPRLAK